MSKSEELRALAARCEAATDRDMELDRDISVALDLWWVPETDCPGPWTASLDAAMQLVPKDRAWVCGYAPHEGSFAAMRPADQSGRVAGDLVSAASPMIALCAAALKARAEESSDEYE